MQRSLDIPAEVNRAKESQEILRAWAADGGLVCALRPELWEDPSAWGILLADVARHVANAVVDLKGVDAKETLEGIRAVFNSELDSPTEETEGHF